MCKKNCKTAEINQMAQEIANLRRARDNQAETIIKYQDQDKHQLARIAELETSNQERWERIQYLERECDTMRQAMEKQGTAHASDCIELVAQRERAEKLDTVTDNQTRKIISLNNELTKVRRDLEQITIDRDGWMAAARSEQQKKIATRDQRDQEALARQRVQIELDKATAIISKGVHVTLIGDRAEEVADLRATVYRLQEYGADRDQEIARLRHEHGETWKIQQGKLDNALANYAFKRDEAERLEAEVVSLRRQLNDQASDLAPVIGVSGVAACACDDLRDQLATLHRTGKAMLKYELKMIPAMLPFVESLTRAGDLLDSINERID